MNTAQKHFVIQRHTTPEGIHWDLMLENEGVLWTWRIPVCPEQFQVEPIPVERIADHPLRFLTYEGPVQQQTGSVKLADQGTYTLIKQKNKLQITFAGKNLCGNFIFTQTAGQTWTLQKKTSS